MRWHHHFAAAGLLALLYPYPAVNMAGGVMFGVAVAWWGLGGFYGHSLKAWWVG